jgi:branched-chain amino acid transport system ATP-binding protein
MALLEVSGLHAGYGGAPVLHGVELSVEEGEICAVLGPNGAGKTTTLRAISGLVNVTRGHVRLEGDDITKAGAEGIVAKGIAHVPEGRGVFPALSVLDNLRLGGYLRRDAFKENLERVFGYFPVLGERRDQLSGTLSGGEQQMLAIGRGLMSNPKLVLVDEASLGLAPIIVKRLFGIIQEINASGTTVLMVEQNASFTLAIAHKAFLMQKGTIVFSGTAAELKSKGLVEAYLGSHAKPASADGDAAPAAKPKSARKAKKA